jgi:O-antigen ligase
MNIAELKYVLPLDHNNRAVLTAGVLIVIVSVVFTSLLGMKALIVLPAMATIWAALKSRMNLIWVLIALQPMALYYSVLFGNLIGYVIPFVFIVLWFSETLIRNFKDFRFSGELIGLLLSLIFISTISILPGGISKSELFTLVRILFLLVFIIAFYDSVRPGEATIFFIALAIPNIINAYDIIRIYLSTGSLLNFIALIRLKPGGIFNNANSAGFMFLISSPFWISMIIWHEKKLMKIISIIISSMLLIGLVLTGARASIVGIAVSLFFFLLWKKKLKYLFGLLSFAFLVLIFNPNIQQIIMTVIRVDKGVTTRDVIWTNTINIIKENPMFGIGIGNYSHYYDRYFVLGWERGFVESVAHAHNLILSKTAELGILGLIWVIFLYIFPLRAGYAYLKRSRTDRDRILAYGIIATFFGLYTQSMFEAGGMLQEARFFPDAIFWMIFAIVLKAKDDSQKQWEVIAGSK